MPSPKMNYIFITIVTSVNLLIINGTSTLHGDSNTLGITVSRDDPVGHLCLLLI